MKYLNKKIIMGLSLLLVFFLVLVLIQFDKDTLTLTFKKVGMSTLNERFLVEKPNKTLDKLTDIVLYLSLGIVLGAAIIGLVELIKNKSLFKVDLYIITLGISMVVLVVLWILFDKVVIINYRPYSTDEGSFPSTHVMVVSFVLSYFLFYLEKNEKIKGVYNIIATIVVTGLILFTFAGRILSANHWFTDCVGGLALGFGLSYLAFGIAEKIKENKKEGRTL